MYPKLIILILPFILLHNASFSQACFHQTLSTQFDISIELKQNVVKNSALDSSYIKIVVYEKNSDHIIQVIRENRQWMWDSEYGKCENVRSYQTGYNAQKQVLDSDFGDLVIADLNFDGLDDFAFVYDSGFNSGPLYHFYIQLPNHQFIRQVFLSEQMGHFPLIIDSTNQQLIIRTHANAYQVGERTYQYNEKKQSWYLHNRRLLDF